MSNLIDVTAVAANSLDQMTILSPQEVRVRVDTFRRLAGGGGGGAVDSVNGHTGTVVLTASDVGASASNHTHAYSTITGTPTIPTDAHINSLIDSKIGTIESSLTILAGYAEEVTA